MEEEWRWNKGKDRDREMGEGQSREQMVQNYYEKWWGVGKEEKLGEEKNEKCEKILSRRGGQLQIKNRGRCWDELGKRDKLHFSHLAFVLWISEKVCFAFWKFYIQENYMKSRNLGLFFCTIEIIFKHYNFLLIF